MHVLRILKECEEANPNAVVMLILAIIPTTKMNVHHNQIQQE